LVLKRFRLAVAALFVLALCAAGMAAASTPATRAVTVAVTIYGHPGSVIYPGKITFKPANVKAGSVVTFDITNADPTIFHNFEINGHMTIRSLGPHGGRYILRNIKFVTPGKYAASVPNDNHSGIGGVFVVSK
jgi:hypothetical protein